MRIGAANVALIVAMITAASLVGCGQLPGPYLTCVDVPTAECEAAHQEAVTHGLFLDDGEQVIGAVVQPTEYQECPGLDNLLYDVSFQLKGHSAPVVVSVGTTIAGSLAVCTH